MSILSDFRLIKHFVFDIDGVMTDGRLIIGADGMPIRYMNIRDGYALQLAMKCGYKVTILSGATGDGLRVRFARLGITDVHLGVEDKFTLFESWIKNGSIELAHTLYMGDDMPDLSVMREVFLPTCPQDACDEILATAKYISPKGGGYGCVRDVIEKVLKLNGHWR